MNDAPKDASTRVPLSPAEAELVRLAEAEYQRVSQAAQLERARRLALVVKGKVPDGCRWTLSGNDNGIDIVYDLPPASPPEGAGGSAERVLALVPPAPNGAPPS